MKTPESRKEDWMRRAGKGTKWTVPVTWELAVLRNASEARTMAATRNDTSTNLWLCHNNLHFPEVYSVRE